jgi:hypothetical protein
MAGINTITAVAGATDTIVNNNGTGVGNVNATAQLAAITAGYAGYANPALTATAITAGATAALTGIVAFISDAQSDKTSGLTLVADAITVAGDVGLVAGAIVSKINPALATEIEEFGQGLAMTGFAINNYQAVITNTPIAINEFLREVQASMAGETQLIIPEAAFIAGAATAVINAWDATASAFSSAANDISTATSDLANAGSQDFNTAVTAAANALSNTETALTGFFQSVGGTAPDVTTTATGDNLTITDNDNSVPPVNAIDL